MSHHFFPTQRLHEQTEVEWLDVERKQRCCIEAFKSLHNMSSTNVNNMMKVHVNTGLQDPHPQRSSMHIATRPNLVIKISLTIVKAIGKCYRQM